MRGGRARLAGELAGRIGATVDGIDERTLVGRGDEVGIPADDVRRAIAVERLGSAAGTRRRRRARSRVVVVEADRGQADAPGPARRWLVAGHHLRRDRLRGGRGEWRKRTGLVGVTMRTVRARPARVSSGAAARRRPTVRDTGTGTCVVRVEADRRGDRTAHAADRGRRRRRRHGRRRGGGRSSPGRCCCSPPRCRWPPAWASPPPAGAGPAGSSARSTGARRRRPAGPAGPPQRRRRPPCRRPPPAGPDRCDHGPVEVRPAESGGGGPRRGGGRWC